MSLTKAVPVGGGFGTRTSAEPLVLPGCSCVPSFHWKSAVAVSEYLPGVAPLGGVTLQVVVSVPSVVTEPAECADCACTSHPDGAASSTATFSAGTRPVLVNVVVTVLAVPGLTTAGPPG